MVRYLKIQAPKDSRFLVLTTQLCLTTAQHERYCRAEDALSSVCSGRRSSWNQDCNEMKNLNNLEIGPVKVRAHGSDTSGCTGPLPQAPLGSGGRPDVQAMLRRADKRFDGGTMSRTSLTTRVVDIYRNIS